MNFLHRILRFWYQACTIVCERKSIAASAKAILSPKSFYKEQY